MSLFPITITPIMIPSLIGWWDAVDPNNNGTQLTNGSAMAAWKDKSGFGYDATQATGAQQPTYSFNAIAGLPGVLYSGNQWMDTPTINYGGASLTEFVVVLKTNASVPELITGNNNFEIDCQDTAYQIAPGANGVGAFSIFNIPSVLTMIRQSGNSMAFQNGVQSGFSNVSALSAINNSAFTLGTRNDRAVPLIGYIAEVLLYNRALSSSERNKIELYLGNKWGLPVPLFVVSPWSTWNATNDGTQVQVNTDVIVVTAVCSLNATSFVMTYKNSTNSNFLYAVVGTISGNTITWGTQVAVNASAVSSISICALSSTSAIIAYVDSGANAGMVCYVGISGTTITAQTPVSFLAGTSPSAISIDVLDSTHAILAYAGASNFGKANVLSVSGTTITVNTVFSFNGSNSSVGTNVCALSSSSALVTYSDGANSGFGTAQVLSITGTTITGNTSYVINSNGSTQFQGVSTASGAVTVIYQDTTAHLYQVQALSIFGSIVSSGAKVALAAPAFATSDTVVLSKADSQTAFVSYKDAVPNASGVVVNISGTNIILGTPATIKTGNTTGMSMMSLDSTHIILGYRNNANSNRPTGIILVP